MSSAKHTPGPWKTSRAKLPSDGAYDYAIGADFGGQTLAIAEAFGRVDDNIYLYPDAEANAHLIAAAPDMLEALKECADDLQSEIDERYPPFILEYPGFVQKRNNDMEIVIKARAAIAKAEGRS